MSKICQNGSRQVETNYVLETKGCPHHPTKSLFVQQHAQDYFCMHLVGCLCRYESRKEMNSGHDAVLVDNTSKKTVFEFAYEVP